MFFTEMAWAQAASPAKGPTIVEQLFPFLLIFVIFYFLLIRPAQKRNKTHQTFLTGLKRGDSVLTSSGIFGTIEGLNEQFVTLKVSEGVNIRVLKSQIASPINEDKK